MPGAKDNASGVATVLALGERVLPGAEEAQALGIREWVSRHRGVLDRSRTLFVDRDKLGAGAVHYARKEGLVFPLSYDARLLGLCEEIARK